MIKCNRTQKVFLVAKKPTYHYTHKTSFSCHSISSVCVYVDLCRIFYFSCTVLSLIYGRQIFTIFFTSGPYHRPPGRFRPHAEAHQVHPGQLLREL